MSGIHGRPMTVAGRAWVVLHPLRFQAFGLAAVFTLLGLTAVGQPAWRIAIEVTGFGFCLWFGGCTALINYRARHRAQRRLQVK